MPSTRPALVLLFCWAAFCSGVSAAPAAGIAQADARRAQDGPAGGRADPDTAAHRGIDPVSDDARFSLLTILPGDEIYSLWGHSAVRVQDPARDINWSFNYGTFQFDRYFLPNFLYGRLDYLLSVHDYEAALDSYRAQGRPVIEQVLRLSPAQKDSLFHFLAINARPENRVYRYHFLYDNCSTRIRDALERSLGTSLRFGSEPDPGLTFRRLLDDGIDERPFLDAGIDWLLGAPVDRLARPYETMFLPEYLMLAFDHATIHVDGDWAPLVARTDTVLRIPGYGRAVAPFPLATVAMWILFLVGAAITAWGVRAGSGVVRLFDVPLFAVVGIAGTIIVFLWFISLHDVTENNWHLLWAWPTHLAAAAGLLRRQPRLWLRRYLLAASVVSLAAAAGSPLWEQWFHPALYPLMLLVALRGLWIFLSTQRLKNDAPVSA